MSKNKLPKRKQIRLSGFDYSSGGAYFITICTHERKNILSKIYVGGGAYDAPIIELTDIGKVVEKYILSSNNIQHVTVDKYVIMPNHIHLILIVNNGTSRAPSTNGTSRAPSTNGTSRAPSPTNNVISHTVSTLKRFVNREARQNIFQRSFYDHIIRDENDYLNVWNYIDTNALKWADDCYYQPEE